jgi:hypothetical protein
MGSKKLALVAALTVLGVLGFAPSAFAWTFSASGSVKCDTATGQQVITWTLDNHTESQTMTVQKSDRAAVPVGSTVAKYATATFTEKLPGTTTGTVTLNVQANWPSDQTLRLRTATVSIASACNPPDVCPNIDGAQATVPSGYQKDSSGKCIPIDLCPNIDGAQAAVPSGYVKDGSGNCVIDVCPNIDGIQLTVPAGSQKDSAGKCIPIDLCPNIDGAQATVPAGLAKDSAGNCTPPDVCTNIEGVQTTTPAGMLNEAGVCHCPPQTITVEKTVEVPVEKVVPGAPVVITKTKVIVKKVVVKPKKKKKKVKIHVKAAHHKVKPGALPFTP